MNKIGGLGVMLLAGFFVIPGNLGFASQALAQNGAQTVQDKQLEELRQKRIETLQEQEREAAQQQNTDKRKQDALKRQQDAIKRQKAIEQLEKEGK
jgi:hypothetical protein